MSFASSRISLQFGEDNAGQSVINWEEYSFDSDFLITCDAFVMKVGDKNVTPEMRKFMQGGQGVKLYVDLLDAAGNVVQSNPIFTGNLDKVVEQTNSRGGTFFTLHGRNILGPLCDSGIDPWSSKYKFVEGQTLGDVLGRIFAEYGIESFYLTDAKNRDIVTGNNKFTTKVTTSTITVPLSTDIKVDENGVETVGPGTTTKTITQYKDPTNDYDLADKSIKKLQPRHDQTFMQFIEENLARFRLHCWAMADGSGIVIGAPDYIQPPYYKLINRYDGKNNNVIDGRLQLDFAGQPSMIIARGFHGGGDFATTTIKCAKVNEYIGYNVINEDGEITGPIKVNDVYPPKTELQAILQRFKGLKPMDPNVDLAQNYSKYFTPPAIPKVIYWEDEKSRTLDQLKGAVSRKMSEYQRHAFKLHYTVQDHHQDGVVWKHNMIVTVNDQILGIDSQPFWIAAVSMKKSRSRGTVTELTLIPVGTLQLGPA